MRNVKLEFDDESLPDIPGGAAGSDWKDPPMEVLKAVDEQLAFAGMEVVIYNSDDGSDTIIWSIEVKQ